jgi:thiol-disulfide isomerase/thioredoxin
MAGIFIFFSLLLSAISLHAQSVPLLKLDELEQRISGNNDTLYVVNFWATWCKPCIEELPYFEKLNGDTAFKNVKVLLVSLDFPSQLESKVEPFLKRKKLMSEVFLLDEKNPNAWIDRVSAEWSGAIPATLFVFKNKRVFHEKEFEQEELYSVVNSLLKE